MRNKLIFINIFESQAKRLEIPKKEWVTDILVLLQLEIISLMYHENGEQSSDYD